MNDLKVFNNEVIPVYISDTGEKVVIGRELHERLKIETPYTQWFDRMCEYGFTANTDFQGFSQKCEKPQGGRPTENHYIKLDMAKHIAMLQRTPQGFAIRQKLIELEKNVITALEDLSPQLRMLINIELKQKEQDKAIQTTNRRLDDMQEVISLNPNAWRGEAKRIISKIANKLGGFEYIRDVNSEINKLIDARAGVSLETRLTNKRRRLADEGASKTKRGKVTKLDVIAEDKKLIEIYIAIVKEMAVKNGVTLEPEVYNAV